jgi:hypothetical protein
LELPPIRRHWILRLPGNGFSERVVRVSKQQAVSYVTTIRGGPADLPGLDWSKRQSSTFGEDLVGGWLLKNGGNIEGLQKLKRIEIPESGALSHRTVDWLLGGRIIVEVKTYARTLYKGGELSITKQFQDYAAWRDTDSTQRAVVLARVASNRNTDIEPSFREDLRHFRVPVIRFQW